MLIGGSCRGQLLDFPVLLRDEPLILIQDFNFLRRVNEKLDGRAFDPQAAAEFNSSIEDTGLDAMNAIVFPFTWSRLLGLVRMVEC